MIITVASFKGGVGKTTTAIHIAAYLASRRGSGIVILADGDNNRSALSWSIRGGNRIPFTVCDGDDQPGDFNHLVIDTPARTEPDELIPLAESSDLLIVPTTISLFALEPAIATLDTLSTLSDDRYRILLTMLPRGYKREKIAREALQEKGLAVFKSGIKQRPHDAFGESELEGVPVNQLRSEAAAAAWSDYKNLGQEIMKGRK